MATRRRSKARAGKTGAGASARTARRREGRDGKTTVPCPACGTEYRIPLSMLEEQISCKSCGRAFVPKSASTRRIRNRNPAQPFIVGGAILVFMVVGYLLVSSRSSSAGQQNSGANAPRFVETGERNPRVRDVQDWVTAVGEGNRFRLGTHSDLRELSQFFEVGLVDGTETDRERVVVDAILASPKTAVMRDSYVTSGKVEESDAEASKGTVRVYTAIKPEHEKKYAEVTAQYDVQFEYRDGRAHVTGFEAFYEPPLRKPESEKRGPRPIKHEIIGEAHNVEREYGGQKEVVREADLKPLPHLEGTSEEIQREIDENIARLIDIDAGGLVNNRANRRLKELGKPAVPRLLNQLYELVVGQEASLEDQNTVLRIRKVTMALEDLTGQRFGFNPSVLGNAQTATHEYRLSSLKQWYGWWADNHWRKDFDYAIDKSEDLFGEPEKPDKTTREDR